MTFQTTYEHFTFIRGLIKEVYRENTFSMRSAGVLLRSCIVERTGDLQETVLDDDNAFLNVPGDYENDEQRLRRSQDSDTVNARGRNLLDKFTNSQWKDCW